MALVEAKLPRYLQLRQALLEEIASGRLRPGDPVPPERVLSRTHGLSMGTVRRALQELVHAGVLHRQQGRGTFVTRVETVEGLHRFFRYTKGLSPITLEPEARVLGFAVRPAPREILAPLGLPPGARVYEVRRLRTVGGEPLVFQVSYLPVGLLPGLRGSDLEGRLLYQLLGERYGYFIARVEEYVSPTAATGPEARLLGLQVGTPVLRIERIAYTLREQAIEYRRSVGRGGDYRYYVQLR